MDLSSLKTLLDANPVHPAFFGARLLLKDAKPNTVGGLVKTVLEECRRDNVTVRERISGLMQEPESLTKLLALEVRPVAADQVIKQCPECSYPIIVTAALFNNNPTAESIGLGCPCCGHMIIAQRERKE